MKRMLQRQNVLAFSLIAVCTSTNVPQIHDLPHDSTKTRSIPRSLSSAGSTASGPHLLSIIDKGIWTAQNMGATEITSLEYSPELNIVPATSE